MCGSNTPENISALTSDLKSAAATRRHPSPRALIIQPAACKVKPRRRARAISRGDPSMNTYPDIDAITARLLGCEPRPSTNGRETPLPSEGDIAAFMREIADIVFPGFFTPRGMPAASMRSAVAASVDRVFRSLAEMAELCMTFGGDGDARGSARAAAAEFASRLPDVRDLLDSDVLAAYEGDPAAKSPQETILCYPSLRVMTSHRVAHELYRLGVPLLPRMIAEMAHSLTGIDIHPGASIGPEFFIDHGTGVVIGETAVIGARCRLYQGVTLGALSFPKDEAGDLIKGMPRHPVLEDCVTVYGGATILGRVTIGRGSIVGGNVWLTHDVPPGSKIVQQHSTAAADDERMIADADRDSMVD